MFSGHRAVNPINRSSCSLKLALRRSRIPEFLRPIVILVLALLLTKSGAQDVATDGSNGNVNGGSGGDVVAAIQAAINDLQAQIGSVRSDLSATIDAFGAQIQALGQGVTANAAAVSIIPDLEGAVDDLDAGLTNVTLRVGRLDKIQQLWRRNFRAVNQTFTALRAKGVIGGGGGAFFRAGGGGGGGRPGRKAWVRVRNGGGAGFLGR